MDADAAWRQERLRAHSLAIAILDLFVVAWTSYAFGGYELDENEQKVLDSCREDQRQAGGGRGGRAAVRREHEALQWKIIKRKPGAQEKFVDRRPAAPSDEPRPAPPLLAGFSAGAGACRAPPNRNKIAL